MATNAPYIVRPEAAGDAAGIAAVHKAAFPTPAEADLVSALRVGGHLSVSLVAEQDGQIVGHIAFSPVTIEGQSAPARGLGLAPVAVLPSHQRRGIGSALVREGLAACRERSYGFVVVLGHPTFYPRFGFRRAGEYGLDNEYGADEAFMVVDLSFAALPRNGLVRYAQEFQQLS